MIHARPQICRQLTPQDLQCQLITTRVSNLIHFANRQVNLCHGLHVIDSIYKHHLRNHISETTAPRPGSHIEQTHLCDQFISHCPCVYCNPTRPVCVQGIGPCLQICKWTNSYASILSLLLRSTDQHFLKIPSTCGCHSYERA